MDQTITSQELQRVIAARRQLRTNDGRDWPRAAPGGRVREATGLGRRAIGSSGPPPVPRRTTAH